MIYLFIAGNLETGFAICLKYSEEFTGIWPTLITTKSFSVGTAYAVWTGIGAVETVLLRIVFLKGPSDLLRLVSISPIVDLRISSPG